MPQEPKKRHSKAAKRIRRAAIKLAAIKLIACPNCGQKTLAHQVCQNCGFYRGKMTPGLKPKAVVTKA